MRSRNQPVARSQAERPLPPDAHRCQDVPMARVLSGLATPAAMSALLQCAGQLHCARHSISKPTAIEQREATSLRGAKISQAVQNRIGSLLPPVAPSQREVLCPGAKLDLSSRCRAILAHRSRVLLCVAGELDGMASCRAHLGPGRLVGASSFLSCGCGRSVANALLKSL